MQPNMTAKEAELFQNTVRCSERYLEFGSGGSTCVSARLVGQSVTSVDSSADWHRSVAEYCRGNGTRLQPELVHVDIGPTGEWGYPTDEATTGRWAEYHTKVWEDPKLSSADTYMVDGRFRVACFMQVILHCERDAVIIFHDFTSRPQYHAVKEVAREVARAEDLSVFVPLPGRIRMRAAQLLESYKLVTQ